MMKESVRIYLAGDGTLHSQGESGKINWKRDFNKQINLRVDHSSKLIITDPEDYFDFNFLGLLHIRESRDYCLRQVKKSDVIIICLDNTINYRLIREIGTAIDNQIPVIAFTDTSLTKDADEPLIDFIETWLTSDIDKTCVGIEELVDYIYDYYCFDI